MKYLGGIAPILCIGGIGLEWVCHSRESGNPEKNLLDSCFRRNDSLYNQIHPTLLHYPIPTWWFNSHEYITGINVVIPAHYHGSIVGISIACMGYCYLGISVIPAKAGIHKIVKKKSF